MLRALSTLVAAAAISAPAMIAPAAFTPAAAQASMNIGLNLPGPAMPGYAPQYGVVPTPVYYPNHRWEERRYVEHRAWERDHWRDHRFYDHHYYR
jgi:hypothetical protein